MSTPKVIREARAAVAAIEAQAKAIRAKIAAASAERSPLAAKVSAIAKRRGRVAVIKNLAGDYIVGTLADLNAELRYAQTVPLTPKGVRTALEAGTVKIGAGGYGQSYSLKGLLPRLRVIEPASYRAYLLRVKARIRLEAKVAQAKRDEAAAFDAAYKAGAKPDPELVIRGIVEAAIARAKADALPHPANLEGDFNRLTGAEFSPLAIAKQHLAFALSGSAEPCPCATCARARQEAKGVADWREHAATLPKVMVECAAHGRARRPVEVRERVYLRMPSDPELVPEPMRRWYNRYLEHIEVAMCDPKKGQPHELILLNRWLEAQARAEAKANRRRVGKGPQPGDQVDFTCPNCGQVNAGADVYVDDDDGAVRVACEACELASLIGAVSLTRAQKAA